jgi:glycosyltransferase involved in cell wall biosynthesis
MTLSPPRPQQASPTSLRVLALTRKPHSASFEQRVLNYINPLEARHVNVTWREIPKTRRLQHGLLKTLPDYDLVWWHRYLISPWSSGKWRKRARRIVFDFDDPLMYSSHGRRDRPNFTRSLKFSHFLRRCDAALPASEFLAERTRPYCRNVFVVPMAIDVPVQLPVRHDPGPKVELLWVGSKSTMRFLRPLAPVLAEVGRLRPSVRLRLVGHEPMTCPPLEVDFRRWSPQEQQQALSESDIGLCPLPDTPWSRGKCPYKVLQYMAHGMAWVGAAVGENLRTAGAVDGDQTRGLCATDAREWTDALLRLIDDREARLRLGANGRAYVESHHHREVLADRLVEVFRQITAK